MTPRDIANIIGLVLVLIIAGFAVYFYNDYQNLKTNNEALGSVATVTGEVTDALGKANAAQQEVNVGIGDRRATQDAIYEKLKRNNPGVRSWADTNIPDELRQSDGALDGLETDSAGSGVTDPKD